MALTIDHPFKVNARPGAHGTVELTLVPMKPVASTDSRIEELFAKLLCRAARRLDPNWLQIDVQFRPLIPAHCARLMQAGTFELNFMPLVAKLNGPANGDIDLLPTLQQGLLHHYMMLYYLNIAYGLTGWTKEPPTQPQALHLEITNDAHRITPIPDRMEVRFDYDERYIVESVDGRQFVLKHTEDGERCTYTPEGLREDFLDPPAEFGGPVEMWYLPRTDMRPVLGSNVITTIERISSNDLCFFLEVTN